MFVYIGVQTLLYPGLQALLLQTLGDNPSDELESTAKLGIFLGLLVILGGMGVALHLSIPSSVADEMIEF